MTAPDTPLATANPVGFTPGPWVVTPNPNGGYEIRRMFGRIVSVVVAEVNYQEPIGRANARLIAAAPDMLTALIQITSNADDRLKAHFSGRSDQCERDYAACMAAIARATGGAI